MRPSRFVASCLVAPLVVAEANAQDWFRFRGPNGAGVAPGSGLPLEFEPAKNLAWRLDVPDSSSSPVLTQDAVFLTASTPEKLLVLCVERADGSLRWTRELERARTTATYPVNDSASPSPVTDGENVYAFFPELGLVSCDAKGEVRWTVPLGPFVSFYGMAASPIVVGDALVLLCDQQQGSYLLAVERASGAVLWKTERKEMIESWTTPVLFPADAPTTVVVFGSFFVCGYSLENGAELWRHAGLGYAPVCSPIVDGNRIYASTPFHAEEPLPTFEALLTESDADKDGRLSPAEVAVSPIAGHFGWADSDKDDFIDAEEWAFVNAGMSTRDFGLVALELVEREGKLTTQERWRFRRSLPSIATPLLYQGVLYLVKDGGILTALDADTGAVLKSERLPDASSEFHPSPIAADGRVYVASNAGDVYVLAAGGEWKVLGVNSLGEELSATPAIAGDALYVRTSERLYCFRQGD